MTTAIPKYFTRQGVALSLKFHSDIQLFVIIPVLADELIFETLKSLAETDFRKKKQIGIIVVVNHSKNDTNEEKQKNKTIFLQLQKENYPFHLYPVFKNDVDKKIAGVGFSRKTGMDQAALFFYKNENPQGIIVSLDADTTVSKNYFTAIFDFFRNHPDAVGSNIHFEHPLEGTKFSNEIYEAITLYELHLRYFTEALCYINFPYAYQTVGSAFAVRARNYVAAQGISVRQGGEDFYFLNKLFDQGFFGKINSTCVFPSPRPNNKTPFGTGVAVKKILENPETIFKTYSLDAFLCLKEITHNIELLWKTNAGLFLENEITLPALKQFLQKRNFCNNIEKIKKNSTSFLNFQKAFFRWFDMFAIIKFLNETAEANIFPKKDVVAQANRLASKKIPVKELLLYYRKNLV
ncbi:MAG: glycosyltransferase family 2 protein [Bacteroidales bacterium]|nr:glycosyltransferase family 2 protein [Bacteroidales bacterium]